MMTKYLILIWILLCLIISPMLVGCGSGTETGNPIDTGEEDTGDDGEEDTGDDGEEVASDDVQTAAEQILDALCTKLSSCFSDLASTDCETGILETSQIDNELGLTEGAYLSYQEIIDAENDGDIEVNSTPLQNCLTDIDALECTDSTVIGAYEESDADNFDNVENMVPEGTDTCEGVY